MRIREDTKQEHKQWICNMLFVIIGLLATKHLHTCAMYVLCVLLSGRPEEGEEGEERGIIFF